MTRDAGYGPASALQEALRSIGHECDELDDDEASWYFDFTLPGRSVAVFQDFVVFGEPSKEYFAVHWHVRRPLWAWLLRRRVPGEVEAQARLALDRALRSNEHFSELRWLSYEEFLTAFETGRLPAMDAVSSMRVGAGL